MFGPQEAAAELQAFEEHLAKAERREQDLQRRLQEAEDALKTEQLVTQRIHADLSKERSTIDELLNKMEAMELEVATNGWQGWYLDAAVNGSLH